MDDIASARAATSGESIDGRRTPARPPPPAVPGDHRRGFFRQVPGHDLSAAWWLVASVCRDWPCLPTRCAATASAQSSASLPLDALPDDGVPRRFPVIADRERRLEQVPARADRRRVCVRRDRTATRSKAFNVTCPHAGLLGLVQSATRAFSNAPATPALSARWPAVHARAAARAGSTRSNAKFAATGSGRVCGEVRELLHAAVAEKDPKA